ncbi:hypothetical protein HGA88_06065 [Candidatus Roizmanbacteria bacterium]|nr:hypothetical protein [Candidatus Roizmanbacteria bacterium]
MNRVKKIILISLLFFFLSSFTKSFIEYRKNVTFYEGYKKEYEQEKKRNDELKTEILKKNDPHQIEKTIRNKLNLLKENEVTVLVPNPTLSPPQPTPTTAPVYHQWITTFFKN